MLGQGRDFQDDRAFKVSTNSISASKLPEEAREAQALKTVYSKRGEVVEQLLDGR